MPTPHRVFLRASTLLMLSMDNTVVVLNKYSLASRIKVSAVAIQATEAITTGRGKIEDSRVRDLPTTESMLLGVGVAIFRTSNGLLAVEVEDEVRVTNPKADTLRVLHTNNSNYHMDSPLQLPTKMTILSDLLRICKLKTRAPRMMDYPQMAQRWPLPHGNLREVHQRKMALSLALLSKLNPHLL